MSTTFDYRARDTAGAERKGQLGGSSPMAVARELATMGLVPVEIRARGAQPVVAVLVVHDEEDIGGVAGDFHCTSLILAS